MFSTYEGRRCSPQARQLTPDYAARTAVSSTCIAVPRAGGGSAASLLCMYFGTGDIALYTYMQSYIHSYIPTSHPSPPLSYAPRQKSATKTHLPPSSNKTSLTIYELMHCDHPSTHGACSPPQLRGAICVPSSHARTVQHLRRPEMLCCCDHPIHDMPYR